MIARIAYCLLGWGLLSAGVARSAAAEPLQGALYSIEQVMRLSADSVKQAGYSTVVIAAGDGGTVTDAVRGAVSRLSESGLRLGLWIEVGRDPILAGSHPEWMASIQGHPEWRRFFPEFPKTPPGQVVKVFPWVPISFAGAFEAQLAKVKRQLAAWPEIRQIFLNDIQAAPSACGCGHPLCRWTTDYGPVKTAENLGDESAARFIESVASLREGLEVIPVWATECEEGDKPGLCAGVGCFGGACWREWTAQLEPVVGVSERVGALLLQSAFDRPGGDDWLRRVPAVFSEMPKRYERKGIGPERLIAVIEGAMPTNRAAIRSRIKALSDAGVDSYLVAVTAIEQSWEPRHIAVR